MDNSLQKLQAMCDNLGEQIEATNALQKVHCRPTSVQLEHSVIHQSNRHRQNLVYRTVNIESQRDQYRSTAFQPHKPIKRPRSKHPDRSKVT